MKSRIINVDQIFFMTLYIILYIIFLVVLHIHLTISCLIDVVCIVSFTSFTHCILSYDNVFLFCFVLSHKGNSTV